MDVLNYRNNITFQGRVYYANKTAQKFSPQYREIIHQLKYHTVNKELSHNIYLEKLQDNKSYYMNIVTSYKHPKKVNGYDEHVLEQGYLGFDFNNVKKHLLKSIKEIPSWKRKIDLNSHHEPADIKITPKKKSFWNSLKNIFHL